MKESDDAVSMVFLVCNVKLVRDKNDSSTHSNSTVVTSCSCKV